MIDLVKQSDCVTTSVDDGSTVATVAGVTGRCHAICKVDASFTSSTVSKTLTVAITTIAGVRSIVKDIHGAGAIDFGVFGLQATAGTDITATLAASGTGGVVGRVDLTYYTTGPNN
jgi:3-hydroxyisobutyrate dehydrogenase-like beta-hydroxyacid dehydrogenase